MIRNGVNVGTFTPDGVYTPSDFKEKKNIDEVGTILPFVLALSRKKYLYKSQEYPDKKKFGLAAQDVQE